MRAALAYLERLQGALGGDRYVVVEKILTGDEELPPEWPVAGTTGYEFARAAVALLGAALPALRVLQLDPARVLRNE